MKIMKQIQEKAKDNINHGPVTIAFLGDSVTQGCFEVYKKYEGSIETVFDREHAYHNYLNRIFSILYPSVPISIVNAGISGDKAPHGLERLERDILRFSPDLVVVCFGLNDSTEGISGLDRYKKALKSIFKELQIRNIDSIFMTPNMMNTYVSNSITDTDIKRIAKASSIIQNENILDTYIEEAIALCEEYNVTVCDCYSKWKKLNENGVDITELLANKINHPTKEMNWLFAVSLFETIINA